jgi:purine-binding chemotaxis protein CheW
MSRSMETHRHRHDPLKNLVGFVLGDVHYAVPIARVREIANPQELVELPHAPHSVAGVADYRGEVVPVVDMRARFGLPEREVSRRTKWIVVDLGDRLAALVVDGVTEVFGSAGMELRPPPQLGGGEDVRGIAGVTKHGAKLVFVLDTERIHELTESLAASGALGPGRPPSLLPREVP